MAPVDRQLTIQSGMKTICSVMQRQDSGLEVRDRMWLKINIPAAFIGADVVNWLFTNVTGFSDKREAKKYASQMLKVIIYIYYNKNNQVFNIYCRLASSNTQLTNPHFLSSATIHSVILLQLFSPATSRSVGLILLTSLIECIVFRITLMGVRQTEILWDHCLPCPPQVSPRPCPTSLSSGQPTNKPTPTLPTLDPSTTQLLLPPPT